MTFDGIDDIDWTSLQHAFGSAADVPDLLRALLSEDARVRDDARSELYGNIWHQGTVYEATAYAVPFLFRLALTTSTPDRVDVVSLIGAIAEGLDLRATAYQDALARVVEHRDSVRQLLNDREPMVRAAASYVTGAFASLAEEASSWLRASIETESDTLARCGMLLGLARLADHNAENVAWIQRRFRAATDERERVAAAIALGHAAGESTPPEVVEVLSCAAEDIEASTERFRGIPWDLSHEEIAGEALVATGRPWSPPW